MEHDPLGGDQMVGSRGSVAATYGDVKMKGADLGEGSLASKQTQEKLMQIVAQRKRFGGQSLG